MPEFYISKIILYSFHVDNNEGELGIDYDIIIGCDLMLKLGLMSDFTRQFLQWYGAAVTMKDPNSFLGEHNLTNCDRHELAIYTA